MTEPAKVRVALVDDEDEARALFGSVIGRERDLELVATGTTGRDALRIAGRMHPDVMVLDVNMPDVSGMDAAERIAAAYPAIGLILITGHESLELVKRALRVGVKEFLAKPIGARVFVEAIRRVDAARDRSAPGHGLPTLWAFLGAKGTSGATTLAVNVACELARTAGPVALVDADLAAGDCAFQLDLEPAQRSIGDLLANPAPVDRMLVAAHLRRWQSPDGDVTLAVLESPGRYVDTPNGDVRGRELIDELSRTHRHVVVDLPPGRLFDPHVAVTLDLADEVLLLTNADLPSLKSLAAILRTLIDSQLPPSKIRVLVNHLVSQEDLDAAAWIRDRFSGMKAIAHVPVDRDGCTRALAAGLPLVLSSPSSRLSAFMTSLVDGRGDTDPQRTGWLADLWQRLTLRPS